jgi:hypothetical protein
MSNSIQSVLDNNLNRKTISILSLNTTGQNILVNCDRRCFDFDKIHPNNSTVDALEYNKEIYYLIEFKDERVYNPIHNWQKIMAEIVSKGFQSINSILDLYVKNNIQKIEFYKNKINLLIVFSSTKSTDLNDFKTLKIYLKEKYGNILNIDILDERMFIEDYINTKKAGIN